MSIVDTVEGWLVGKALAKGVASAAKLIVSFAISHGIKLVTAIHGIAIDTTNEAAMTVAINSALKVLFDWMKAKWPALTWLP